MDGEARFRGDHDRENAAGASQIPRTVPGREKESLSGSFRLIFAALKSQRTASSLGDGFTGKCKDVGRMRKWQRRWQREHHLGRVCAASVRGKRHASPASGESPALPSPTRPQRHDGNLRLGPTPPSLSRSCKL